MNQKNIRDQIITVEKFVSKSKRPKTNQCNLYIKNFPASYTEDLCEVFVKTVDPRDSRILPNTARSRA